MSPIKKTDIASELKKGRCWGQGSARRLAANGVLAALMFGITDRPTLKTGKGEREAGPKLSLQFFNTMRAEEGVYASLYT